MAQPLLWPGRYHFYPIGGHPALCLTRDLPPEQDARLLLLPCGDPRNVLYTVYSEASCIRQLLDFTCCDFDAGILARDVLLLAMIMDDIPTEIIWKVYLDMYLDAEAMLAFTAVCRQLVEESKTSETWRASSHGSTLRMATEFTLEEVRRHWSLYLAAATATGDRASELRRLMDEGRQRVLSQRYVTSDGATVFATGRSAGPLILRARPVYTEYLHRYWNTGTTSLAPTVESLAEACVNPTFLYSRLGEGFAVHHETEPLAPFHLAHVFGNDRETPTPIRLVGAALEEFSTWCNAFRVRVSARGRRIVVRFIMGDVLAVSGAFQSRNEDRCSPNATPMASWTHRVLQLDTQEYDHAHAPTCFDAIDTSDICDNVGLVNVLLSTIPLLVDSSPHSGIIYTESTITTSNDSDLAEGFEAMLVADLTTHSLLFGVTPVSAVSGFTTQCDTHELLSRRGREGHPPPKSAHQHHQMLTWRRPWTADTRVVASPHSPGLIHISPPELCLLLSRIYDRFFVKEDPPAMTWELGLPARTSGVEYTREMFIGLLRFLQARLRLSEDEWSDTVKLFLGRQRSSNMFDSLVRLELNTLLHRYRVFTIPALLQCLRPRGGRMSQWKTIPPLVRIYLTVPHEKLAVIQQLLIKKSPHPPLHCVVQTDLEVEHVFQSVRAFFGHVVDVGTPSEPAISLEAEGEDALPATQSPLILSFIVPAYILTNDVAPETIIIQFSVDPADVVVLSAVAHGTIPLFSARFEDLQRVHVVPEACLSPPPRPLGISSPVDSEDATAIGKQCAIDVELGNRKVAMTLTARLLVEDTRAKATFSGGAMPVITQTSPCMMRVVLGSQSQTVTFPVPVVGSDYKGRLARKSSYIELVLPIAIPALRDGTLDSTKFNPFSVVPAGDTFVAWNMHRLDLDQLPMLDTTNPALMHWFDTHISLLFSEREGTMKRRVTTPDTLTLMKDTIHYILSKVAGLSNSAPKRVFALRDDTTNDSDTVFFVHGLRYDLSAHTVVCDAFVLPLFPELMPTLRPWFGRLVDSEITNTRTFEGESRAWKQLLPALVERCRTSWRHGPSCEYITKRRIPLSVEVNGGDPLCSCGRGKDVEAMRDVDVWRPFAPFVTRIAVSPLFAVSYLEQVIPRIGARAWNSTEAGLVPIDLPTSVRPIFGPPPAKLARQCKRCSKSGRDIRRCGGCQVALYCSQACQKADWKSHKPTCGMRK